MCVCVGGARMGDVHQQVNPLKCFLASKTNQTILMALMYFVFSVY